MLAGLGPLLLRQGAGYMLRLRGSALDSRDFSTLADEALAAGAAGDHERCIEASGKALALWRGAALEDVALGASGRIEAERLDERRLRVLEERIDAELAVGRQEDVIGELQVLVNEHPYRERFVAQLMLALYRTGRHVDALDAYEGMRGVLAEVGLQPSAELQQLSGRIVRQEAELERPRLRDRDVPISVRRRSLSTIGVSFATAISLVLAVTASGSTTQPATATAGKPSAARVALVLPRSPGTDEAMRRYRDGLRFYSSVRDSKVKVETIVRNVERRLLSGRFGLVVWVADDDTAAAGSLVKALPSTKFVFVDTSLQALSLQGVANASAIRFAVEQTAELVGYLSAFVPPLNGRREGRADVIGVVGGFRTMQAERNLAGLKRGLGAAQPGMKVLVDYANETSDRTRCEQLANSQIDRGADVVVAFAGRCGSGAVEVARVRGVWGAGDIDGTWHESEADADVLVRMHKEYEMAMDNAVTRFLEGSLPNGRDLELGLNDNYAVGLSPSWKAPETAVSKMVARCTEIRRRTSAGAAP